MPELMTEDENLAKYPHGTPAYKKDEVEHYRCWKHDKPTYYLRDSDIVVHSDETECN